MTYALFDWAVIGAGPAGIAAVGKLIDCGVDPKKIAWIDPEFKVGDFGTRWKKVSSNTKVQSFLNFFEACRSFEYSSAPKNFAIQALDPARTCFLSLAADSLQWITDNLKNKVKIFYGKVQHLKLSARRWELTLVGSTLFARNVVLAIGAEPKSLLLSGIEQIPLCVALDPDQLKSQCNAEDVIAVFGSSHSAIVALKNLLEECSVNRIFNFYLQPLRYAVCFDDWFLFDDTGLKSDAADWARKNIDGDLPPKLKRIISNEENIRLNLPLCNKAIYATGFQRRFVSVEGMNGLDYNNRTGIIAPGLFGLGIAFPEAKTDPYGTVEYRVGIRKFMEYLDRVMPLWLCYGA